MKHLLFLFLFASVQGQTYFTEATLPDTLIMLRGTDEMTGKIYLYPSRKLVCKTEDSQKAVVIWPLISDIWKPTMFVKGIGFGCVEKAVVIFLFEDGSRLDMTSWNQFNCDGRLLYLLDAEDWAILANRPLKKIRLTNGNNQESLTEAVDAEDRTYFIRLMRLLAQKRAFEYRD